MWVEVAPRGLALRAHKQQQRSVFASTSSGRSDR